MPLPGEGTTRRTTGTADHDLFDVVDFDGDDCDDVANALVVSDGLHRRHRPRPVWSPIDA